MGRAPQPFEVRGPSSFVRGHGLSVPALAWVTGSRTRGGGIRDADQYRAARGSVRGRGGGADVGRGLWGDRTTGGKKESAGSSVAKVDPIAALVAVQKKAGQVQSARIEGDTTMGSAASMKQRGAIDWSDGLTGSMKITYTGGTMADA